MAAEVGKRDSHLDDEEEDTPKKKRKPRNKAFIQKLDQDDVNYGATQGIIDGGERACANCRWFQDLAHGNLCLIVQEWPEPITEPGLCDRWEAFPPPWEPEPMEVIIVDSAAMDEEGIDGGSFMDGVRRAVGAARAWRVSGEKATTKRERGIDFPKAAYAWAPGSEVSNWAIRLWANLDDKVTRRQLGAAAAALSPSGFRGNRVQLKDADGKRLTGDAKTAAENRVKGRIRRAFRGLGVETSDIPASVKEMGAVAIGLFGTDGDEDLGESLLEGPGFKIFGDKENGYRWLGWTTNKWRDREGDVFSEAAHKEYVEARDAGTPPGDVWFWHIAGTSFAECDFAAYADGFLIESGPFKKDMDHWAESLAGEDYAMSHTFIAEAKDSDPTEFVRYRIVERGPLPRDAAANPWTGFAVNSKEAPLMGLSPEKKKALEAHIGEDATAVVEAASVDYREALEEAGVDSKDLDETHGLVPDEEPTGEPDPEGDGSGDEKVEAATADVEAIIEGVKSALGLDDLVEGLKAIIANQEALDARMDAVEKTDDQKIAEKIQPANGKSMFGFMASTDKSTKVSARSKAAKGGPEYEAAPEGAKGAGGLVASLGALGTAAGKAALEAEAEAGASSAEGVL